jgi:hypothetical protein
MKGIPLLLPALLLLAGCAGTTHRVASEAETNGVRYFAPATYVLVKPDHKKSKATVTFLTLPDTTRLFAAAPYSWMAANDTKLESQNGTLAKVVSNTDTVKVPMAAIEAATTVAKTALDAAAASAKAASAASAAQLAPDRPVDAPPPIFLFYSTGDELKCVFPEGHC